MAPNLANTLAMYCGSLFIKDAYYTAASILLDWPGRIVTMLVTMIPYIIITFIVCDRLSKIYVFDFANTEKKANKEQEYDNEEDF